MNENNTNNHIDVSFITINYNVSSHTIKLINSIIENSFDISYEIIIIDNASEYSDFLNLNEFCSNIKNTKLIRNRINSGFAGGNMLGVNYARGTYYFFINNDAILLNNAAKILKDYLDNNKDIAVSTSLILDENNNRIASYNEFPRVIEKLFGNSIQRLFLKTNFPTSKIRLTNSAPVEVISGSCMFFRGKDFCDIGGFDPIFFLYCEEEDLCKRVWNYGKKVYFVTDAKIMHKVGGSTNKSFEIEREFYISYYHLIEQHYNNIEQCLLKFALFLKLFLRIFKRKMGLKIFLSMLNGFSTKNSLRYSQKVQDNN